MSAQQQAETHNAPEATVLAAWLQGMSARETEEADVCLRLQQTMRWLAQPVCTRDPTQLAALLRLVRGAPIFGPKAMHTVLVEGAPTVLAELGSLLCSSRGPSPPAQHHPIPAATYQPATRGSHTQVLYPPSHPAHATQQPAEAAGATATGIEVLLPTILSQAIGNLSMSAKVWEPCAMALYACCRENVKYSHQLCGTSSLAAAEQAPIWALLLSKAVVKTSPASDPKLHTPGDVVCSQWSQLLVGLVAFKQGLLQELLACLPFQEAALQAMASNGIGRLLQQEAIEQQQQQQQQDLEVEEVQEEVHEQHLEHRQDKVQHSLFLWGHHTPVLLHILAHEVENMMGSGAGTSSRCGQGSAGAGSNSSSTGVSSGSQSGSVNISSGQDHATGSSDSVGVCSRDEKGSSSDEKGNLPLSSSKSVGANSNGDTDADSAKAPWQRTLSCLMSLVLSAAAQSKNSSHCSSSSPLADSDRLAAEVGNLQINGTGTSVSNGVVGISRRVVRTLLPDQSELSKHVLEAALEVLKCLGQREDKGMGMCGGVDPVLYLCESEHLILHLLGLLHALQPVQSPGRTAASAAAAATKAATAEAQQQKRLQQEDQDRQGKQQPQQQQQQGQYTQPEFTNHAPIVPPYLGYRGDVLAVLANAVCDRPTVAEGVANEEGAVELVLGQCQLDDLSPLAREWGLWAVRNLCAGSLTAQQRIRQLEPVQPVESPELRALGMRLEMDHDTGKLKVVKTNEPPQL